MARSHDGEVAPVDRGQLRDAKPLGNNTDRSIHHAERQIGVPRDELGNPIEVRGDQMVDGGIASCERS